MRIARDKIELIFLYLNFSCMKVARDCYANGISSNTF